MVLQLSFFFTGPIGRLLAEMGRGCGGVFTMCLGGQHLVLLHTVCVMGVVLGTRGTFSECIIDVLSGVSDLANT